MNFKQAAYFIKSVRLKLETSGQSIYLTLIPDGVRGSRA